ncbi:MAG: hypothetical protein KGH98_02330 [Candidatus Micrarchaeota archaeon]|nr:hypothetical protein [Candidatus Micrarchaeota archaeon]
MRKSELNVKEGGAVVVRASTDLEVEELLERAREISAEDGVIQLFDADKVVNKTHLIGAFVNAARTMESDENIAKDHALEMLLFAGMTRQIGDAIKGVGAKDARDFVVFADSPATFRKLSKHLKDYEDFRPSRAEQAKRARRHFGIKDADNIGAQMLQKMAVTRLID